MGSGCLVLVDGWNHYVAALRCFGYGPAAKFPLDRLALHVAAETGADTVDKAAVVMALPDRNHPGEAPEFYAWRKRLRRLSNYGIRHKPARFSYHQLACTQCSTSLDRSVTCGNCGTSNATAGRRKEKGADIRLASLALRGAWQQELLHTDHPVPGLRLRSDGPGGQEGPSVPGPALRGVLGLPDLCPPGP